jgi:ABC-2 type transport system ATP-binding protein
MKSSLLRQELLIDADNRLPLTAELTGLGLNYTVNEHITVPYQGRTAQDIIAQLKTKLTMLKIHEPSLEDAYVEFLNKTKGNTIEGTENQRPAGGRGTRR